ncbi:S8 family serine peptidase [Phenylobacterium sp. LjRoot225]|uniref:S8 family serine peptidase n=1 Tax=Phenylobacterium sp. LjRoot225 TaxID=3342285 RepID=UPI003ECD8F59
MSYEYKVAGQPVRLDPDPTVVAVRFKPGPKSFRAGATAAAGVGPFSSRFEVPGEELTLVPTAAAPSAVGPSMERASTALRALNAQDGVSHALPVFRVAGNQVVTTDRVIVGLDTPQAAHVVSKHGLEVLKAEPERLVVRVSEGADPFAVSEALSLEPGVSYAEPDFVTIGRHVPKRVGPPQPPILNDPLIQRQYAMTITGTAEAWKLQEGDPKIRIAILDEGVQTLHPDLAAAIVDPFDATQGDQEQEPNHWDGHGTSCAGLAAAVGGNEIGVRGVAAGASLMPVRIAYSQVREGPWITSNSVIRDGIKWAWTHGADVLSNSWGGGAPSNDISAEFERARKQGRNGLGCVVVIAAGNTFDDVTFPATLADVLTVAASNEYDEAKTPTSRDGETWWGTCHGPEVDVAAPGVHNMTTDIGGADGYTPDDYIPNFNGTSSATPIVAGACALVLSADPSLTGTQVARIITDTAQKVGQFPYANGRNDYFGAGRLDVLAAVRMAQDRRKASKASASAAATAAAPAK